MISVAATDISFGLGETNEWKRKMHAAAGTNNMHLQMHIVFLHECTVLFGLMPFVIYIHRIVCMAPEQQQRQHPWLRLIAFLALSLRFFSISHTFPEINTKRSREW